MTGTRDFAAILEAVWRIIHILALVYKTDVCKNHKEAGLWFFELYIADSIVSNCSLPGSHTAAAASSLSLQASQKVFNFSGGNEGEEEWQEDTVVLT